MSWWLMADGLWLVAGGWWLVAGGWWRPTGSCQTLCVRGVLADAMSDYGHQPSSQPTNRKRVAPATSRMPIRSNVGSSLHAVVRTYVAPFTVKAVTAMKAMTAMKPKKDGGIRMTDFYAEIADVIERFFYDVDILEKPDDFIPKTKTNVVSHSSNSTSTKKKAKIKNDAFKIYPDCSTKKLKK